MTTCGCDQSVEGSERYPATQSHLRHGAWTTAAVVWRRWWRFGLCGVRAIPGDAIAPASRRFTPPRAEGCAGAAGGASVCVGSERYPATRSHPSGGAWTTARGWRRGGRPMSTLETRRPGSRGLTPAAGSKPTARRSNVAGPGARTAARPHVPLTAPPQGHRSRSPHRRTATGAALRTTDAVC